jgi:glycosyltransferase involved in cell wall biosynthesis
MNILIISFDADPPYMGGAATVANILAKGFMSKGHFCALGYLEHSEHPSIFFKNKVKLVKENRVNAELFFQTYQFDIILNQIANITDFNFLKSLPLNDCKIISAYHNRPMFAFPMLYNLIRIYHDSNNFFYKTYTLSKIPLLPFFWIKTKIKVTKSFQDIENNSDKIILLSDKYIPNWLSICPKTKREKLISIGNPLVFEESISEAEINTKEKLVIVVCSVNSQKRAHLLIKIWKRIEKDPRFDDWKFEFIGGGEGISQIIHLAKKNKLKRIIFEGYKNTYPYYKRASIMMMTSKYEGWPMVLMEGQQMGVIPVSYNSFESITDIINDGENGIIIPNNDMELFVSKMKDLMLNNTQRRLMATNAINSSSRFNLDNVINRYLNLFTSLASE